MLGIIKIPQGMRDWLPVEAQEKRQLMNDLLQCLALWGYAEVSTPLLEYYQTFLVGTQEFNVPQVYKLIDREGCVLALRPEITLPIARVVSSKLGESYPLRLMYGGEVFRYEETQTGKQREFCQVGVELIGAKGVAADSEVLALAIEALLAVGLRDFTVSLGHMGILEGLLESLPRDKVNLPQVRQLILKKDFVGLSTYLLACGLTEKRTKEIINLLTQQPARVLLNQEWPDSIARALTDLQKIISLLAAYGYAQYVQLDLSTLREQTYYTGSVFEIYTAGLGYPLGGGGRYDQLLEHWGKPAAATGFALGVERILLSLPRREKVEEIPLLLVGARPVEVLQQARELRKKGHCVLVEIGEISLRAAEELARNQGATLVFLEEKGGTEKCQEK